MKPVHVTVCHIPLLFRYLRLISLRCCLTLGACQPTRFQSRAIFFFFICFHYFTSIARPPYGYLPFTITPLPLSTTRGPQGSSLVPSGPDTRWAKFQCAVCEGSTAWSTNPHMSSFLPPLPREPPTASVHHANSSFPRRAAHPGRAYIQILEVSPGSFRSVGLDV